jgi:D-amino peptidase
MRHYVHTDLEGVVGVDSFSVTRGSGADSQAPAMDRLAREVNACVAGIREADPDADIDVWDLHGSGGLREADVRDATYRREGDHFGDLGETDAMYFVGQHAMAGTAFAPLRHTYDSTGVAYYRLDGTFVGEFGCRALIAGKHGVPSVLLTGDDKACHEAEMFVPEIGTVTTKYGTGEESADHRDPEAVLAEIREASEAAARRVDDVPPLDGFEAPHVLEVRYDDPVEEVDVPAEDAERVDAHTVRIRGRDLTDPADPLYRLL